MERHKLALIIPAFNEAKSIANVLNKLNNSYKVLLVNDGSVDDTSLIANKLGAIVIDHPVNLGYDCSLNSGFEKAKDLGFEYAITLDADGQHDPSFIKDFINEFKKGADIVLGIRYKKQRFSEIIFALYTNLKWDIRDPLCGFKGYKLSLFEELGYFDKNKLIGTELMLFEAKNNYKISQIKIDIQKRNGKPKFGTILASNLKILKALIIAFLKF